MLYEEVHKQNFAINIYKGTFRFGQMHGSGESQKIRINSRGETVVEYYVCKYEGGIAIQKSKLSQEMQINFPQVNDKFVHPQSNYDINHVHTEYKSYKQTCLEELDSMTKINELVQKYPRIDKEW